MPPAASVTMYAYVEYVWISRQIDPAPGTKPTTLGCVGFVALMNQTPFWSPKIAISIPLGLR
jgi:hypothetical protein